MINGETFFSYDINILRVIRLCVVEDKGGYVSAVEIYGTTTRNLRAIPRYDIYSTPIEAYKGMLEHVKTISEIYFREDYAEDEESDGEESEVSE